MPSLRVLLFVVINLALCHANVLVLLVLEKKLTKLFLIDLDHSVLFVAFTVHHLFILVDVNLVIFVAVLLLVDLRYINCIIFFLLDLLLHTCDSIIFAVAFWLFNSVGVIFIILVVSILLVNTCLHHLLML